MCTNCITHDTSTTVLSTTTAPTTPNFSLTTTIPKDSVHVADIIEISGNSTKIEEFSKASYVQRKSFEQATVKSILGRDFIIFRVKFKPS